LKKGQETADPDTAYNGDLLGDYYEGGHPGYGLGRECGFPLVQEVLTGDFVDFMSIGRASDDANLADFLGRSGFKSWGGTDYWKTRRFRSVEELKAAFCESISLYCPSISDEDLAVESKYGEEFESDNKNVCNLRFKSLVAMMEGQKHLQKCQRLEILEEFPKFLYSSTPVEFDSEAFEVIAGNNPPAKTIQFAVWIISNEPNEASVQKISRICKAYSQPFDIDPRTDRNGPAQQALLIVLCPELAITHLVATPFKNLLDAISQATGESIAEDRTIVKLVS
jgi:hypothetical protein